MKMKNFIFIMFMLLCSLFLCKNSIAQQPESSDTITLDEQSLDSINFYLSRDFSRIENTVKDTLIIRGEDNKVYKIPYKVTSIAIPYLHTGRQYFRMTGLTLEEDSLGYYLQELFRNPRRRLRVPISNADWKNSETYRLYFEPYDQNSEFLVRTKETAEVKDDGEDEFQNFLADGSEAYVIQNYENFPLPQTIDLEVDLKKTPRALSVLGLEFNFDKLSPEFQKLLLKYGNNNSAKYRNRRSIDPKSE